MTRAAASRKTTRRGEGRSSVSAWYVRRGEDPSRLGLGRSERTAVVSRAINAFVVHAGELSQRRQRARAGKDSLRVIRVQALPAPHSAMFRGPGFPTRR